MWITLPENPKFSGSSSVAINIVRICSGAGVQVVASEPCAGPVPPPIIVVIPAKFKSYTQHTSEATQNKGTFNEHRRKRQNKRWVCERSQGSPVHAARLDNIQSIITWVLTVYLPHIPGLHFQTKDCRSEP